MSIFSSGKKWKRRAEAAINSANTIADYQNEVEFRRQLLSNIRQERIARAQLEVGNYNPVANISTKQGTIANIDSSLAGEADFSYSSSIRQQQMTDYTNLAQKYYNKYQKAQKTRAGVYAVGGLVAGALTGGLGFGLTGGIMGAQIGQGVGQIASGTGQTQLGIQNILSGGAQTYMYNNIEDNYQKYLALIRRNRYELASVNPQTNQIIPGSQVYAGNYMTLKNIRGYQP